jgi:hypothetical protein
MLNSLSKDERKLQLLESRLGGTTTRFQGQNIDLTTSPLPLQNIPENASANTPSINVGSVLPSPVEILKIGQDEQTDNDGAKKIIFLERFLPPQIEFKPIRFLWHFCLLTLARCSSRS